jgi:hypothetical protein
VELLSGTPSIAGFEGACHSANLDMI